MKTRVSRAENICFVVDEEAIRSVANLFQEHNIDFGMQVETIDHHTREFSSDGFFDWSERAHKPIKEILFASLKKDEQHSFIVSFRNADRNFDFDPAMGWRLRAEEDVVQKFDTALSNIASSIKQPFSPIFGAGPIQVMLFSLLTFGTSVISLMFIIVPQIDKWRSDPATTPMDFRFPDGKIVHGYTLEQVPPLSTASTSTTLHFLPYILVAVALMAHLLRRMFAVGVFNFGFDRRAVSRSLGLRTNIFWGGVIAATIAVVAPIVSGLLGL